MYIQSLNIDPSTVNVGDVIEFTLSNGSVYCGEVTKSQIRQGYYVEMPSCSNTKIFDVLRLNATGFVADIVDYHPAGVWPETNTLEELRTVLCALLKVNKPEEEIIEEIIEELKPSSEWDWLLG